MTAGFGAGQIAGPLTMSLLSSFDHAFTVASAIAALALIAGNCVLLWLEGRLRAEPSSA